jgi:hypothetical protein
MHRLMKQDLCRQMAESAKWVCKRMCRAMQRIEDCIQWDEGLVADYAVSSAWCEFNVSAIMNALNLNGCRAMVVSDILSFLGMHQKSFMWFGYTNVFCGGGGHLMTRTDDGKATAPSISKVHWM